MPFNSLEYIAFLIGAVVLHFMLPDRYRWVLLLIASYAFYMSWSVELIVLILFATGVTYLGGLAISRARSSAQRRAIISLTLSCCLGLLFFYKYWGFFGETLAVLLNSMGLNWQPRELHLLLPVGISFYTFQALSYAIDVYRGSIPAERHLGRYALYVAFFPQLVAGPIERGTHLLPQMARVKQLDWQRILSGWELILWGLIKKVIIADRLALYVDAVYNNVQAHNATSFLLATYAFAFQIYCDFSAYSDIAIGSARILGFDLMTNFRTPYFSQNITEFWRRWHISLSTWLRDYLYIPLGGNRRGAGRTQVNLMLTMLLGGLWHGASWNFVIWGAIHGGLLVADKATLSFRNRQVARLRIPGWAGSWLGILVTFHLVCFAWIFFRANTFADAASITAGFAGDWGVPFVDYVTFAHGAIGLALLLIVDLFQWKGRDPLELLGGSSLAVRGLCWNLMVFAIALLGVEGGAQFIYFQF